MGTRLTRPAIMLAVSLVSSGSDEMGKPISLTLHLLDHRIELQPPTVDLLGTRFGFGVVFRQCSKAQFRILMHYRFLITARTPRAGAPIWPSIFPPRALYSRRQASMKLKIGVP